MLKRNAGGSYERRNMNSCRLIAEIVWNLLLISVLRLFVNCVIIFKHYFPYFRFLHVRNKNYKNIDPKFKATIQLLDYSFI